VTVNSHASSRLIATESGIKPNICYIRILHNYKFHPYHLFILIMSFYQNLYGNNFANCVNFCNWMRRQLDLHSLFTYYLMFFDEALFINAGQVKA